MEQPTIINIPNHFSAAASSEFEDQMISESSDPTVSSRSNYKRPRVEEPIILVNSSVSLPSVSTSSGFQHSTQPHKFVELPRTQRKFVDEFLADRKALALEKRACDNLIALWQSFRERNQVPDKFVVSLPDISCSKHVAHLSLSVDLDATVAALKLSLFDAAFACKQAEARALDALCSSNLVEALRVQLEADIPPTADAGYMDYRLAIIFSAMDYCQKQYYRQQLATSSISASAAVTPRPQRSNTNSARAKLAAPPKTAVKGNSTPQPAELLDKQSIQDYLAWCRTKNVARPQHTSPRGRATSRGSQRASPERSTSVRSRSNSTRNKENAREATPGRREKGRKGARDYGK